MAIYYLSPTGSDSNPGTQALPFGTFGHTDSVLNPGDTVIVLPGTYIVSVSIVTTHSGTSGARITWQSQTRGAAKIIGTMNNSEVWITEGNWITITGFEVTGQSAKAGISVWGNNTQVVHNYVHDLGLTLASGTPGAGIFTYTQGPGGNTGNNEIAYNLVVRCGIQATGGSFEYHCIYHSTQNSFVHHNICVAAAGYGIAIAGEFSTGYPNNTFVANNLLVACCWGGIKLHNTFVGAIALTPIQVQNNIAAYNGTFGVTGFGFVEQADAGTGGVGPNSYLNNLSFGNASGDAAAAYQLLSGVTPTSPIYAAPTFRNYKADGSGDYHQVRPGPAIGAGTGTLPGWLPAQFGWTVDYDGTPVPQGGTYDVGPYELPVSDAPCAALIGGAPVNVVAGSLHVENQIGQRSTGGLSVWSALGVTYQYGTQVLVFDDTGALAYSGYTTKDKITKKGGARQGTGYLEHDLQLMDNCYRADKRRVFKTYLAQTAGYIVNDLLGTYLAPEGVTKTATSIATGPTITEVIWSGTKSVSEALTWLATQCGYWWNIDVNGVLWFQPYSGLPAPLTIDGTQIDAQKDISVEVGNDMYVNKQFTKGGYAELAVKTETFHGDSLRRNWTLSYPVARLSGIDKKSGQTLGVLLNGVAQTLGTKGVDNGQPFYYATGDAVLAQDPAQTLLTSGDTLVVTYVGRFPALAAAQNPALIAAQQAREGGGTGLVESTYNDIKVHTLSAAFQIASALLSHYGQDTTVLSFATRTRGLMPGQTLPVSLPDFNLNNKQMLISGVTISDQVDGYKVWYVVQAVGSPVESAQWQTYWQNLMNQSSDPTDRQDISDTNLALLLASTVSTTWSGTVTKSTAVCPIWGNATIANTSLIFC